MKAGLAVLRIAAVAAFAHGRAPRQETIAVDIHFLAAVTGAYLLAGFVKGVIGMGLPGVAIGLLGLMVTPAQAAAILIVPSLATNTWQGLAGKDLGELLRRLWPMFVGIFIGTIIGAVVLPRGNGAWATPWLGLVLAAYAMLGLLKLHFFVPPRLERPVGFAVGIVNGVVAVATGVFAIPGVPYLNALRLEHHRLVQGLGLMFTISTVALAAALYHRGELNASLAWPALLALLAALCGMPLGQLLRSRIKPQTFRLWFFVGLLLLGTRLALRGVI
jgi:uncharacterized protein